MYYNLIFAPWDVKMYLFHALVANMAEYSLAERWVWDNDVMLI